jgi:hypothetical protein
MPRNFQYLVFFLSICWVLPASAQYPTQRNFPGQPQNVPNMMRDTTDRNTKKLSDSELVDTLRKREERKRDTVIFTSKYIRFTKELWLNDSTQVFPLDTGLANFQHYSLLYQPRSPKIGLGNLGLAQRSLLFEPDKSIGFDVGMHTLDLYLLRPQDIQYFRARTPYTELYYVNGASKDQLLKVVHSQNIKPNWNVGLNYNKYGSEGFYQKQKPDHLNAALFTWYESPSKRYNLLANLTFNNLKAPENGSILNDTIFTAPSGSFRKDAESVRLSNTRTNVRNNGVYLKQFYYIGRVDSLARDSGNATILPTQRVAYTLFYNEQKYKFFQNNDDTYRVFPNTYQDPLVSRDSFAIKNIQNEFSYSFYLRGKPTSFVKNELKLDLGLRHDFFSYGQYWQDSLLQREVKKQSGTFQNITLKAKLGYRFSDRASLATDFQQIVQGRNAGDYLYDAKLNVLVGNRAGRIILGAYTQNNAAPLIYTRWFTNHYQWPLPNESLDFDKVKTSSFSFNYLNEKLRLDLKAEYFLISNYLYFQSLPNSINVRPTQLNSSINLLKVSLAKDFTFGKFHLDNYVVYQKTDFQKTLLTPELYTYNSLYYGNKFFKVLDLNIGVDVRYNTEYNSPSYAVGLSQFYNGPDRRFSSYPIGDLFIKGTLKRTNLLLKYNYFNQGLFTKGFYTVNRYPMQDALLLFGVSWKFYN